MPRHSDGTGTLLGYLGGKMKTTHRLMAVLITVSLVTMGACSRSDKTDTANKGSTGDLANGDFGTLKEVCGPGPGGNTGSGIGITPADINLGTISDPGSSIKPGLNQEIFDASDVFVSWCNSLGGINGHQIKLDKLDAQLFQHKQRILEACANDFALVGGGGVFDDQGQEDRVKCMLPQFPAFLTNEAARSSDLTVQPVPTPSNAINVGTLRYLRKKFPTDTKVGILTGSVPSLIATAAQLKEAVEKDMGMETVYNQQYNSTGEATWVPFAQGLKSAGVQALIFLGEPGDFAKLAQSLDLVDFEIGWIYPSANLYDQQIMNLGGSALKNVYISALIAPFESAGNGTVHGKAMEDYLALFQQYLPDGNAKALLGVNSFSAWLLFAEAAKPCGANVTRKCVYENGKKIKQWNAGGLVVPANPGDGLATECSLTIQATPEGFKTLTDGANTDKAIFCSPSNVVKVSSTNDVHAPKLADFGKTVDDLP